MAVKPLRRGGGTVKFASTTRLPRRLRFPTRSPRMFVWIVAEKLPGKRHLHGVNAMSHRHACSLFYRAVCLFTLSLIVVSCGKKETKHGTATAPPPTVVVERIDQRTVPIYSEYVGQ